MCHRLHFSMRFHCKWIFKISKYTRRKRKIISAKHLTILLAANSFSIRNPSKHLLNEFFVYRCSLFSPLLLVIWAFQVIQLAISSWISCHLVWTRRIFYAVKSRNPWNVREVVFGEGDRGKCVNNRLHIWKIDVRTLDCDRQTKRTINKIDSRYIVERQWKEITNVTRTNWY